MTCTRRRLLLTGLICSLLLAPAHSQSPVIQRISLLANGAQTDGPSINAVISEDGNYVAYETAAPGWGASATSHTIVRFETVTYISQDISQYSSAPGTAYLPAISRDGSLIAFAERPYATGVPSTLTDRVAVWQSPNTSTTSYASLVRPPASALCVAQTHYEILDLAISKSGRYLVFSTAANIAAGAQPATPANAATYTLADGSVMPRMCSLEGQCVVPGGFTNDCNATDIIWVDTQSQPQEWLWISFSLNPATGGPGPFYSSNPGYCQRPSISDDGQTVVFEYESNGSAPQALLPTDAPGLYRYVYMWNRQTPGQLANVGVNGAAADSCFNPSLSPDAKSVAFHTCATVSTEDGLLQPCGGPSAWCNSGGDDSSLVVRNLTTNSYSLVKDYNNNEVCNDWQTESFSLANGGVVVFTSAVDGFVSADGNLAQDLFVTVAGQAAPEWVTNATVSPGQQATIRRQHCLSQMSNAAVFSSNSSTLDSQDTNATEDIFLWGPLVPTGTSACFGDGSGAQCPCGNNSTPGAMEGCLNSFGMGGKLISTGNASISADTVSLFGTQMPNSSALYFQGTSVTNNGLGVPFGDGLRCAGGSILRLGTKSNSGGGSTYPSGSDPSVSVRGLVTAPGTRWYQIWYRNSASYCTAATWNLSNGVKVTWTP